jgi:hypothetical protein
MVCVGPNPHLKMRAIIERRSPASEWAFGLGRVPELILDVTATSKMAGEVAATSHLVRGLVKLAGMRTMSTWRVAGGAGAEGEAVASGEGRRAWAERALD